MSETEAVFPHKTLGFFNFLRRILPFVRPHRRLALLTFLAAIVTTLMEMVPPWLIKVAIDEGIRPDRGQLLRWLVGWMVLACAVRAFANRARIRFNNRFEQRVIFDIRNHVYQVTQRLSVSYFENRATGEIMSRINNDIETMERIFIDGLEHFIIAFLTLFGVIALLFVLEWRLALVALLPIPILMASSLIFSRSIHHAYRRIRQKMADFNGYLQDALSGIRETMVFNRHDYEVGRFAEKSGACCAESLEVARLWSNYSPWMAFFASMGTVLILGMGSFYTASGRMTVGELVAFLSYAGLFYAPMNQIHAINQMMQHALAAGERVLELIDTEPEVKEPLFPQGIPGRLEGQVHFRAVSFAYVPGVPVLRQIDFECAPGETVALVGATGSGKSTMVSLLMRFYDVKSGAITLDGHDLRTLSLKALRDQIGLVRQEPFLFNATVRENIVYGDLSASGTAMLAAARAACADDFIQALPKGYETIIGERGVKLSIGQKQRLAIARAFLKNPPIIVFDEGTSSVDAETEEEIQEAMGNLFKNRMTLIIAHRLSSLRGADRILVLDRGKIVQTGRHGDLIQARGVYANLFQAQLKL